MGPAAGMCISESQLTVSTLSGSVHGIIRHQPALVTSLIARPEAWVLRNEVVRLHVIAVEAYPVWGELARRHALRPVNDRAVCAAVVLPVSRLIDL